MYCLEHFPGFKNRITPPERAAKTFNYAQSLAKLYVHIVFHIKNSHAPIRKEDRHDLYAYIGTILNDIDSMPILINGTENHLHVFCNLSKNIALAKLTKEIKRHSSRWIKGRGVYNADFAWQGGYAGFSVSQSLYEKTKRYIANQE